MASYVRPVLRRRRTVRAIAPVTLLGVALGGCASLPDLDRFEIPGDESFRTRVYAGAAMGNSHLTPDTRGTVFNVDDTDDLGTQLRLGVDVHDMLAVELDTSVLGTATLREAGTDVNYSAASISALVYGLDGVQLRSRREGWSAYGRFGIGVLKKSSDVVALEEGGSVPILGLGAEYGYATGARDPRRDHPLRRRRGLPRARRDLPLRSDPQGGRWAGRRRRTHADPSGSLLRRWRGRSRGLRAFRGALDVPMAPAGAPRRSRSRRRARRGRPVPRQRSRDHRGRSRLRAVRRVARRRRLQERFPPVDGAGAGRARRTGGAPARLSGGARARARPHRLFRPGRREPRARRAPCRGGRAVPAGPRRRRTATRGPRARRDPTAREQRRRRGSPPQPSDRDRDPREPRGRAGRRRRVRGRAGGAGALVAARARRGGRRDAGGGGEGRADGGPGGAESERREGSRGFGRRAGGGSSRRCPGEPDSSPGRVRPRRRSRRWTLWSRRPIRARHRCRVRASFRGSRSTASFPASGS